MDLELTQDPPSLFLFSSYVAMIRNGNVAPAQKLFSRYREYFNHSFGPELHRLALLHNADQLEDVEFLANNSFV